MTHAIIIPARYGSTRYPGKPLAILKGLPVIHHVHNVALSAANGLGDISVHITTDDERIADYCSKQNMSVILTKGDYVTGTDRVMAAAQQLKTQPDFIINLQGDAPLTPPDFVRAVIDGHTAHPDADIITPIVQLNWQELDNLRQDKHVTPFSGTAVIKDNQGRAIWFSKNIIPAIRKEAVLREEQSLSPVFRHIGLYGYKLSALKMFIETPPTHYEELEGLEQLRSLEAGLNIQTVLVDYKGRPAMTGIDSPEDLARAEALLAI